MWDRRAMVGAYVQERLIQECRKLGHGHQAKIVKAVKMSSAHISNIITGEKKVGDELAHRVAENLWHIPYSELETLAVEWSKGRTQFGTPTVKLDSGVRIRWPELEPDFPNLVAGIRALEKRLSEATIEEACGMAIQRKTDLDLGTWIAVLEDIERRRLGGRQVIALLPAATRPAIPAKKHKR